MRTRTPEFSAVSSGKSLGSQILATDFQRKIRAFLFSTFRPLYQKAGPRQEPRKSNSRGRPKRGTGVWGFRALASGFNSKNLSWSSLGRRRVDGVGAFLFGGGAGGVLAWRIGQHRIFGQGFGRHDKRPAGAALCQPQIRSCERQGRSDQGQRRRLDLHPLGPAGRNHRRIRELAPRARFRGRRGLGLSLAAVGPPHRGRHHEDQGRTCAALRSRRSDQRDRRPPAGRRRRPGQEMRGTAGAASSATASTAGSNSSGCGASTPDEKVE